MLDEKSHGTIIVKNLGIQKILVGSSMENLQIGRANPNVTVMPTQPLQRKIESFLSTQIQSLLAYTDVNWADSITNRRSTSRYCPFVWGNMVTWRSKKQNVVARSSAEAEYRAMTNGQIANIFTKGLHKPSFEILEISWLRKFFRL
ncbi:putative mitochondrial protein, partial [Mucuna pruriens]